MADVTIPGRAYDPDLVRRIREGARVVDEDGLALELRPVPDDDREHVLDPRCLAYSRAKIAARGTAPAKTFLEERRGLGKPAQRYDEGTAAYRLELADLHGRSIPVHVIDPAGRQAPSPVLVYLHGGGFAFGSFEQYAEELYRLADITGALVLCPEYRLSPENPFPAGLDDCCGVVSWVSEQAGRLGADPSKVALAGDSAGGNLCNAVVQRMPGAPGLIVEFYPLVKTGADREEGWSAEAYPVVDDQRAEAEERIERIHGSMALELLYTAGDLEALSDPLISAVHSDRLADFPRTVVVSGEYDFLRVQDEEFARALAAAGADVRAIRYLGMDHGFFEAGGTWPQSEDLCDVIAEEMRRAFA